MQINTMTTFLISATIEAGLDPAVFFPESIKYDTDDVSVVITNDENGNKPLFHIKLSILCDTLETAKSVTESELTKIANTLSWEQGLKIKGFDVISAEYIGEKGERNIVVLPGALRFNVTIGTARIAGKEGSEKISKKLSSLFDPNFQYVLIMWREAISADSIAIQFLLYYRILEHLSGSRTKADAYIISKNPSVELRKGQFGEDVSLYTYLRDNIHAKKPEFPFTEIEQSLSSLSLLVSDAIKESFPQAL